MLSMRAGEGGTERALNAADVERNATYWGLSPQDLFWVVCFNACVNPKFRFTPLVILHILTYPTPSLEE